MIYENCKIYGPYVSKKDSRMRVQIIDSNGKNSTVSYGKYLMEKHLNRHLEDDETVDHIDCNVQNNEISNLRVLKRSEHATIDVIRLKSQNFKCSMCERNFSLDGRKLHDAINNRKKSKAGPFCCRSCAGRYSKQVQLGASPLEVQEIIPSYTTLKADKSLYEETHKVDIAKTANA